MEIILFAEIAALVVILFFPEDNQYKPVLNQSMAHVVLSTDRCDGFPHILCEDK